MTIATRLAHLRKKMKQYQLDAWIVPTSDPHLSEYLPEHWQVRAWLTGFTGSAGVAVVLAEQALLWTDSRYWEQATQQLSGSNIALKKQGLDESYWQYLVNTLPENTRVGIAADMLSWADKQLLQQHFSRKKIELITDFDLIDECWQHRPKLPENKIFVHENKWVGQTTTEKLARIRQAMQTYSVDFHLISSLDDIAWITNLRGSDVSFNPVFLAHLLIDKQQSVLFVDNHKLDENVQAALKNANITWQDYHQIGDYLQKCSGSVLIEGAKTAVSVLQKLPENVKIIDEILPSSLMKAQKKSSFIGILIFFS